MTEKPEAYGNDIEVLPKKGMPSIQKASPTDLLEILINKGADLATLEKFMDLKDREEKNNARKAYVKAMADFKSDPPSIYKDKTNSQFNSKYSSIDALVNPAIPYLSQHGLSHNWDYGKEGDLEKVTCTITHELGHSEAVSMTAPADKSGGNSKNAIQQIKSTYTYLKIATFEAVTGLVSQEANLDDDGNGAGVIYVDEKQLSSVVDMINAKSIDETLFLKHMGAESTDKILAKDFGRAMNVLKKAKGSK